MKRKSEKLRIETYDVIETIENSNSYVEFVPHLWLVPLKKGATIKLRDHAKFYYPRRLANQSKDQILKFTKQAKFACVPPEMNEKWELRNCKVLKMGLVSIEEAIQGQKFYSDYFSTTEAEAVEVQQTVKPKTTKKRKTKAPAKALSSSESDEETSAVKQVSDFNNRFEKEKQNVFNSDAAGAANISNDFSSFNLYDLNGIQPFDEQSLFNEGGSMQNKDCDAENILTLDDLNSYVLPKNDIVTIQLSNPNETFNDIRAVSLESQNQETGLACCANSSCNCYKKLLNKMDYLQKKMLNEFGSIRNDMKLNQEFLKKLLESKQPQEEEVVHQEKSLEQELSNDEIIKFNQIYKNFPISVGDGLIEMNDMITHDEKLRTFLLSKFETILGEDAPKTVRKILKRLCNVNCLSEFTWLGTKKGKQKKSLSSLTSIIDLIVDVIEDKFSNCDGKSVLKAVIQQRTKSAAEAVDKLKEQNLLQARTSQDTPGKSQDTPGTSQDSARTSQDASKPLVTEAEPVSIPASNGLSETVQ